MEDLENIYYFPRTILTLFYIISRRYMKTKKEMKMNCISQVVNSNNNTF